MYSYINSFIDTFQGVKSQAINSIVQDEKYKKPLHAFVDAQTAFAKQMVKIADEVTSLVTADAKSFDVSKAFSKSSK